MELITKAEYARRQEVSRAAVGKWVREGRVVIVDELVDVEASDANLKRYRRYGLAKGNRGNSNVKAGGVVLMSPADTIKKVEKLDWTIEHDWSAAGQAERARQAAKCIGWVAVTSPLRDDGHHGGFQLRMLAANGQPVVVAGYGFELSAIEVICECRDELEPLEDDGDFKMSVRPEFFSALAAPLWESQSR